MYLAWCLDLAEKEVPAGRWIDRVRKISSDFHLEIKVCYGEYFEPRSDLVWFNDEETPFLTPRQGNTNTLPNINSLKDNYFFLLPKSGTPTALIDHLLYHGSIREST